ncbi:MAG: DUF445 domain-containing protein [Mycobacteriales bacterium]
MKAVALAFLLGAAVVFVASFFLGTDAGWVGYLRAAAEAAMVGGLADWFAVTALFRHPLGLPIPHTALVPRQKDALATKLGEFVTGNFLTADAVSDQIAEAHLVRRLAERLVDPETSSALGREVARAASAMLGTLDARNVTDYVLAFVRRDLARRSYTPVLGRFMARAIEGEGQRPLIDLLARQGSDYLRAHRDELLPQLEAFVDLQSRFAWMLATHKRLNRFLDSAIALLDDVARDQAHPLRAWTNGLLVSFADDLRTNSVTAVAIDRELRRLVEDPHLQALLHDVLVDGMASIRESLDEEHGDLDERLTQLVRDLGARVLADPDLELRLQTLTQDAVRYAVTHYGDTVIDLIQKTVAGWEAKDASRRIELAVGRDLQFIRINCTVVGALAGVAIHSVAVLLG